MLCAFARQLGCPSNSEDAFFSVDDFAESFCYFTAPQFIEDLKQDQEMQRVKSPLCLQNPTVMFKAKMYLSLVSFKHIIICLLLMSWPPHLHTHGRTFECVNAVTTQLLTMTTMLDHKI